MSVETNKALVRRFVEEVLKLATWPPPGRFLSADYVERSALLAFLGIAKASRPCSSPSIERTPTSFAGSTRRSLKAT